MNNQLKEVCRMGMGVFCCKYIVCGGDGFECAKLDPFLKGAIDLRVNMVAKGDNCDGQSMAVLNAKEE